jgi:hypothetical protein
MDAKRGIDFDEQMHRVRHDLNLKDFSLTLIRHDARYFLEPFIEPIHPNLPAMFRAPDHMIFE